MDTLSNDEKYMQQALELAKQGGRAVAPNPMVGAIIVNNGHVIGQGVHLQYGGPHAEVNAVNSVINKGLLKGATIYVTLEPCRHHGKTPPCLDLVKKVGIKRIVCGSRDPFQDQYKLSVSEKALSHLQGRVADQCRKLNKYFFTWVAKKRPYITVKVAMSADGYVAGSKGEPLKLTTHEQDVEVHKLRAQNQAIMVSAQTVINDDPRLNVRHYDGQNPLKIIIDSKLRIPLESKVLSDNNHLIIATLSTNNRQVVQYKNAEKNIWICPTHGFVDFDKTLKYLATQNINSILVEPGPTLYNLLKKQGLIDELILYKAKNKVGNGLKIEI